MQVAYCVVHHDQKKQLQRGQFKVGATPTRQPTPLAYDAGARAANHVCDADAMNCWSCEVHQWISKWWLRREWNDMNISMHNWPNESIIESMKKWVGQSMNQWFSESMIQWIIASINESMIQWITEWVNYCVDESMNQWTNDAANQTDGYGSMNQWTDASTNRWFSESMNSELVDDG